MHYEKYAYIHDNFFFFKEKGKQFIILNYRF